MESISNFPPDLLSSMTQKGFGLEDPRKTEFTNIAVHAQKSADISLVTAEGDKVTLSSFSSLDAGYSTYNSTGMIDGVETHTEAGSFYLKKEFGFELSVEGDLNKDELKDILKAIKTIGKMARDFFSGKTEKAIKRASKIMSLDSISSFEGSIHYERSVSIQQGYTELAASLPNKPDTPEEIPVSEPVEKVPSPITSATPKEDTPPVEAPAPKVVLPSVPNPSKDTAESGTPTHPVSIDMPPSNSMVQVEVEQLVEKMTSVVAESTVETGKLTKYVSQFLEHLSATIFKKNDENSLKFNLTQQIQSKFMMHFEETAESEEKEAAISKPDSEQEKVDHTHNGNQRSNRTRRKTNHTHRGHHRSRHIGKMAGDFLSGNTRKAMKGATKMADSGSVSSVEVALHYKQSVSAQYTRTTGAISAPASEAKETDDA